MNNVWKFFPVVYILPFLIATTRFDILSMYSEYARWGVMLLAAYWGMMGGFRRGRKVEFPIFDVFAIGFIVFCFLSARWSVFPEYTVSRSASIGLLYFASFFGIWRYVDVYSEDRFWQYSLGTLGVAMGFNLFLGSIVLPGELIAGRFRGIFENPNNIGMIVGIALPPTFLYWLRKRDKVFLVFIVILVVNLFASGSRSGILASGIACICILSGLLIKRPKLALFIMACLISISIWFVRTDYFQDRVLRVSSIEGASDRVIFWEYGKNFISHRPDLGHGFGTDGKIWEHYGIDKKSLKLRGYGVMSSYYGMAVNLGIAMACTFFGIFWVWVVLGLLKFRRHLILFGYLATVAGGLVLCVFESALYSAGNIFSFLFWIIVMLCVRRRFYLNRRIRLSVTGGLSRKRIIQSRIQRTSRILSRRGV